MPSAKRVAIAWTGLPEYGARLIKGAAEWACPEIDVIATDSGLPIEGLDKLVGRRIHWVEPGQANLSWKDLGLAPPALFVQTGWATETFNSLGHEVRRAGGKVVVMVDNIYNGSLRQWVGALVYRAVYRRRFHAAWVPGRASMRFCRFLGVPKSRIYTRLYGADPSLFVGNTDLGQRPRHFIFVGQLIRRKGLETLANALAQSSHVVHVFGNGELRDQLTSVKGIKLEGFKDGGRIAQELQCSRFLVLPSLEEHWGLVVHEAACCGCGLIVSDQTGSGADLARKSNGWVFKSGDSRQLAACLEAAARCGAAELRDIRAASEGLAKQFGPRRFAGMLRRMMRHAWGDNQTPLET